MSDPSDPIIVAGEDFEPRPFPNVNPDLGAGITSAATEAQEEGSPDPLAELKDDERALVHRALVALREVEEEAGPHGAADNRLAAQIQTYLAAHPELPGLDQSDTASGVESKYDGHDVGFISALIPEIRNFFKIPHRDKRPLLVDQPFEMLDGARLAIFGDWGTGYYGAQAVSRRITEDGDYDAAVHLGDTYYAGSAEEIQHNLVHFLPTVKPGGVRRLCSSNHEMYSGGEPFYEIALPACDQPSTVFTLQHATWVFIGLDTGFQDGELDDDQVEWLRCTVSEIGLDKKLVLFTHHHAWSTGKKANKKASKKLRADLAPVFEYGITAWYWGHVHLCELFEPTSFSLQHVPFHGRCIGHSGYPYFRKSFDDDIPTLTTPQEGIVLRQVPANGDRPQGLVLDGPNEYLGSEANRYGPNGFLRLEIHGDQLHEVLLGPDGTELWSDTIA